MRVEEEMGEAKDASVVAPEDLDRVAVRLAALHGELEEVFLLHQECLMLGHWEIAEQVLAGFGELLALHAQHEESWFLPLYEVVGVEARFPLVLYRGQHQKMLGMVRSFEVRTAELIGGRALTPSERRRRVLALFDEHARFKHLLEHHDGAERLGFMAALDRGASPDVRRDLLDRSLSEWHERRALLHPVLERAEALTRGP